MKRAIYFYCTVLFFLTIFCNRAHAELYISYETSVLSTFGGNVFYRPRLGNQLLTLFKAYRYAKKYQGVLVLMPFDIDLDHVLSAKVKTISYENFLKIKKFKRANLGKDDSTAYQKEDYVCHFPVVYDKFFLSSPLSSREKRELKDILINSFSGNFFSPDKDKINIGLHIRTGDQFDYPLYSKQIYSKNDLIQKKGAKPPKNGPVYLDVVRPTKVPPLQYYIDVMNYFVKEVSSNVRFFLFTDHRDPDKLGSLIKEHLHSEVSLQSIALCGSDHRDFEEILAMMTMDGLIRPDQSTFSLVASFLSDYQFLFFPTHYRWLGSCLVMDEITQQIEGSQKILRLYPVLKNKKAKDITNSNSFRVIPSVSI